MGLLKDIVTLGGSYRQEKAEERYRNSWRLYEQLRGSLEAVRSEIEVAEIRLRRAFKRTKRSLTEAQIMLSRVSRTAYHETAPNPSSSHNHQVALLKNPLRNGLTTTNFALGSAALGTSAAILAWQGAQVVGIASTGTAILGLHGAAASNAGWALFGGGSLATGGGGMALGHLVLPGIGVAVAVGLSAYSTHRRANEISRACDEVESINSMNKASLEQVNTALQRLRSSEFTYDNADEKLRAAVKLARRRLRRYGFLSVLYRLVRLRVKGFYYTAQEELWALELDSEVRQFFQMVRFGRTD